MADGRQGPGHRVDGLARAARDAVELLAPQLERGAPRSPGLLLFVAAVNLAYALSEVLTPPLVLKSASPAVLGTVLASGGAGLLVGSCASIPWIMAAVLMTMLWIPAPES